MTSEKFSLKDHLFNPQKVAQLASEIKQAYPEYKDKKFQKEVVVEFPNLELKQRISHITSCLHTNLPQDYETAVDIILRALPEPLDESKSDDDFGDFIYAPYGEYISTYGCTKLHLKTSLNALKEITKRFSVEYSIRPFINEFPDTTLAEISKWCGDKNYHVRRLCSEGTRAKLPWATKVNINYIQTLPLLHKLYFDKTRYVTRSVANHLNDISKSQPQLVIDTLNQWKDAGKQKNAEMQFITKHALRTLIKDGNAEALGMLGIGDHKNIELTDLVHSKKVKTGLALEFNFTIKATKDKPAVIDYIIYFQNKSGQANSKKVFKLKTVELEKNKKISVAKKHPLRIMTTRQLYGGEHRVEIQINGGVIGAFKFWLE